MPAEKPELDKGALLLRLGGILVLFAIVLFAAYKSGIRDADDIRERVADVGLWAPVLFFIGYLVCAFVPIPKSILSIAAGAAFGFAKGAALAYGGALSGAVLAFTIARLLGREAVCGFLGARMELIDEHSERRGFLAVVGTRLAPFIPYTAINFLSGITAVRARDFVAGSALGLLPGSAAYAAFGAYGTEPTSPPFLIAAAVIVSIAVGGSIVGARRRRSQPTPSAAES